MMVEQLQKGELEDKNEQAQKEVVSPSLTFIKMS